MTPTERRQIEQMLAARVDAIELSAPRGVDLLAHIRASLTHDDLINFALACTSDEPLTRIRELVARIVLPQVEARRAQDAVARRAFEAMNRWYDGRRLDA